MTDENFAHWAILELMGHRRLAGYVTEQEIGGASFLRIDVPAADDDADGGAVTQLYSPSAVYCLTPTTEEIARAVAKRCVARPVHAFELTAPEVEVVQHEDDEDWEDPQDRVATW